MTDRIATFSDSQIVAHYDAVDALKALVAATGAGHESGFHAAWAALTQLTERPAPTDGGPQG